MGSTSKDLEKSIPNPLLSKVADLAPALIVVYNIKTGQYIYCNNTVKKILGYSKEEFINGGLPFVFSLVHPDDVPKIAEQNGNALALANSPKFKDNSNQSIIKFEYRMRHKNGKYRWVNSDGSIFDRDKNGKVLHVMNVTVDITERKNRELHQLKSIALRAEISDVLRKESGFLEILEICLQSIVKNIPATFSRLWLFNENENLLELVASAGNFPPNKTIRQTLKIGDFAAGVVASRKKPLVTNDVYKNNNLDIQNEKWLRDHKVKSFAGYPLIYKNKLVGVLSIFASDELTQETLNTVSTVTDILAQEVERRKIEKKLSESEQRYLSFIQHSSEGIWRFELEKPVPVKLPVKKQIEYFYKYAYLAECNEAMAKMYGFESCDEIVGARLGDMLLRTDPANIKYLTNFINSKYHLTNAESHEIDKYNNTRYFINNLDGVVEDGFLKTAWGTQTDITERKLVEEALRESERKYKQIFQTAAVSLWEEDFTLVKEMIDDLKKKGVKDFHSYFAKNPQLVSDVIKNIKLIDVNDATIDIFEASTKKEMLNSLPNIFLPESLPILVEELVTIAEGKTYFEAEALFQTLKGKPINILFTMVLPKSNEPFNRVLFSVMDITELKKLERQKDEFMAIASHELKTPLTSVKAYTQILKHRFTKAQDFQSAEFLSKMDNQLNKLTNLIADLLDITKIETGKLKFNKEMFSLNGLIDEAVEEIQRTTVSHKLFAKLDNDVLLFADRDRISQVLINLLANAIKYSPEANKVIIRTRLDKGKISVFVRDFGIGINRKNQSKIFERFFQSEGPSSNIYPGLGLGLYISSEIIKRHDGTISVKSIPNKGSTFSFTLSIEKSKKPGSKEVLEVKKNIEQVAVINASE